MKRGERREKKETRDEWRRDEPTWESVKSRSRINQAKENPGELGPLTHPEKTPVNHMEAVFRRPGREEGDGERTSPVFWKVRRRIGIGRQSRGARKGLL